MLSQIVSNLITWNELSKEYMKTQKTSKTMYVIAANSVGLTVDQTLPPYSPRN